MTKLSQNIDELVIELIDRVTYNWAYAPNEYPAEDQTSWREENVYLKKSIDGLLSRSRSKNKKIYLNQALVELAEANYSFSESDFGLGRRKLDNCLQYLKDFRSGKKIKVDFIVSLDGKITNKDG